MNWIKNAWDRSFTDWRYRALLHLVFWFFLLFFWTQESIVIKINWEQHYSVTLVGIALTLFLYYPLVYVIVPLFRKRKWLAALSVVIPYYIIAVVLRDYHIRQIINWYNLKQSWVVGQDFWKQVAHSELNTLKLTRVFFSSISSLVEIIYIPLTIKFIRYAYQFNLKQAWLAKENTQLQLTTLKAQLNPHFFFNTLNNLQSFIVQNEKEKSVDLLNRLADFMRSSLYDCEEEHITMEQEIALLNNYIFIERIRFDENANVVIDLTDHDPAFEVPPFIFLPFIENVFKHGGTQPTENIFINIELLNDADKIILKTKNSYNISSEKGGIGLHNIRKRLEYYFEGKYVLDIKETDEFYTMTLEICKS